MRGSADRRKPGKLSVIGWAICCAAVAMAVRFLLNPLVGSTLLYTLAFAAVGVAAWSAG